MAGRVELLDVDRGLRGHQRRSEVVAVLHRGAGLLPDTPYRGDITVDGAREHPDSCPEQVERRTDGERARHAGRRPPGRNS